MWLLLASLALADPAPAEVRYHRNADVALYGGIPAAVVPPVATGITFALRMEQLGPPPDVFQICRQGPIGALICAITLPVLVAVQIVMWEVWLLDAIVTAAAYTMPLYAVLPGLLVHTSARARRALLDLGEDVPGGWAIAGYTAFGLHVAGMATVAVAALTEEEDLLAPAAAVAVAGWAGGITAGLVQWSIDTKHARAAGIAGPDARSRVVVPIAAVAGRF